MSKPQSKSNTALDNMNELYTWLTAWDKDVNKQVRKREEDIHMLFPLHDHW